MQRTKFLALVLAVAVVLMGAGYAAWTDTFRVDSTIETGELSVELSDARNDSDAKVKVFEVKKNEYREAEARDNINVVGPQIDSNKKKVTFQFKNLFPGTKAYTKFKAKNNGTVPAKINNVTVSWNTLNKGPDGKEDLAGAMMVDYRFRIINNRGDKVEDFEGTCKLSDLERELNAKLRGKELMSNYELVSWTTSGQGKGKQENIFAFEIPHNALNGDQGEREVLNVTIDFDFTQHNTYVERTR
ncbi:MAG TPA: hypothetical protein GX503_07970 [Clostridiales bacterium]|nr:hypothetical protein [Clostridiales bacterium]